MNLLKWTNNINSNFPNFIEKFFGNRIDDNSVTEEVGSVPHVNINEKPKEFEISVAVPGIDKKDINLEVRDNCLIISSEKQYDHEDREGMWMRREFGYSSFQRMFELPSSADPSKIEAKMKNGVLRIYIGKNKHSNSLKTIKIN